MTHRIFPSAPWVIFIKAILTCTVAFLKRYNTNVQYKCFVGDEWGLPSLVCYAVVYQYSLFEQQIVSVNPISNNFQIQYTRRAANI